MKRNWQIGIQAARFIGLLVHSQEEGIGDMMYVLYDNRPHGVVCIKSIYTYLNNHPQDEEYIVCINSTYHSLLRF